MIQCGFILTFCKLQVVIVACDVVRKLRNNEDIHDLECILFYFVQRSKATHINNTTCLFYFFCAGGLTAVIWTDTIQTAILIVGASILAIIGIMGLVISSNKQM